MNSIYSQAVSRTKFIVLATIAASAFGLDGIMYGAEPVFDGGKSTWHDGFVRYDFVMDDETLAITPFTRPEKEGFAVGAPAKGQRRCIVVVPNKPAPGNPWSWQGCYYDRQAYAELILRGIKTV